MYVRDILTVALDVPTTEEATKLVEQIGDSCNIYKVGLELFTSKDSWPFIDWLHKKNKKVFVDLKMYDIPETIYRSILNLNKLGVTYTTIHGCYEEGLKAAVDGANQNLGILAVTLLTSQRNDQELQLVNMRAAMAEDVGCAGAVMSGLEAATVRTNVKDDFVIVCPGIRDPGNTTDDQRRIVSIETALDNGATHLVIGRPITQAVYPDIEAGTIQNRIITYSKYLDGVF